MLLPTHALKFSKHTHTKRNERLFISPGHAWFPTRHFNRPVLLASNTSGTIWQKLRKAATHIMHRFSQTPTDLGTDVLRRSASERR